MPIKLGVIGGVGTKGLFEGAPFSMELGLTPVMYRVSRTQPRVIYVYRYGRKLYAPPQKIKYRLIFDLFSKRGIVYVLSIVYASALVEDYSIGDIVVPSDILDYTPVYLPDMDILSEPIDLTKPFSQKLLDLANEVVKERGLDIRFGGRAVVANIPRYETRFEAEFYRSLGGELLVNHIGLEALFAKHYRIEYLPLIVVSFKAADRREYASINKAVEIVSSRCSELRTFILGVAKKVEQSR